MPNQEVLDYIKNGQKILAVKCVKETMGFSLRDAKEYVENLELKLEGEEEYIPEQKPVSSNIEVIDGMDGHAFEHFCAEVLKKIGYSDVKVTPGSGDQGVDILAQKDGIKYAIQCKNYSSKLSNTPIQEVSAGRKFYNCHVGVVMTNSTFSQGAIELAEANNVLLWDRKQLQKMILYAGGLKNLGYMPKYENNFTDNRIEDMTRTTEKITEKTITAANNTNHVYYNGTYDNSTTNTLRTRRRGMYIWSNICFGWSIICGLMMLLGLNFGGGNPSDKEVIAMITGEGLFTLVFGIMFRIFSKTEKELDYVLVCGIKIKKGWFVFLSIVIAYTFFLGSLGMCGLL